MTSIKKLIIPVMAVTAALMAVITLFNTADDEPREPANAPVTESRRIDPASSQNKDLAKTPEPQTDVAVDHVVPSPEPVPGDIDPVRLAQAELAVVRHQVYEETARETLPTLSIQTHNPIWAIEYEAEGQSGTSSGPQPAPTAGEFGKIQPPEGEIWLRIPPDYAREHRDIMAQNADLYRAETGYDGPVTITLWVGGRPYHRQQYE